MRLPIPHRLRDRHRSRGQSMVEYVLVLPVLLIIALGVLDLGRVFYGSIAINNAARAGAFYSAAKPNDVAGSIAVVQREAGSTVAIADSDVTVTCEDSLGNATACGADPQPGVRSRVSITIQLQLVTPLISGLFSGGAVPVSTSAVGDQVVLPAGVIVLPTPTPTPTPTPAPTPSPTPTPAATPTPTPVPDCVVPNLDNLRKGDAERTWGTSPQGAGFTADLNVVHQGGGSQSANNWFVIAGSQTALAGSTIPCSTVASVTVVQR